MRKARDHAGEQIKEQEAQRSHSVFDVVAEDPQRPHVADEVRPAAMEEHAGDERPIVVDAETDRAGPLRMRVTRRDDAEEIDELLQLVGWPRHLVQEDRDVDRDDRPRHDGRPAMRHRVFDGDHPCMPRRRRGSVLYTRAHCAAVRIRTYAWHIGALFASTSARGSWKE